MCAIRSKLTVLDRRSTPTTSYPFSRRSSTWARGGRGCWRSTRTTLASGWPSRTRSGAFAHDPEQPLGDVVERPRPGVGLAGLGLRLAPRRVREERDQLAGELGGIDVER